MKEVINTLHHLFVPHAGNNHRSKLLHHSSLLVVLLGVVSLIAFSSIVSNSSPNILGISYSINENELLKATNEARAQNDLPPLSQDHRLDEAAAGKASNMFANNYWAHFGPDGTTPWQFIKGSGYDYVYAGENLAKGFTNSQDIVNAWMNSPSHRENLLSPKYTDIGFAVVEGDLLGEDTVLVVQMFGSGDEVLVRAPNTQEQPIQINPNAASDAHITGQVQQATQQTIELSNASVLANPKIDSDIFSKTVTLIIFSMILFALLLDLVITSRKKIPRLVGNNIDHILIVSIFIILIIIQSKGGVL